MRNKFTSLFAVVVFILNIFTVSSLAETKPVIAVGNAEGETGSIVEVSVDISGNKGFSALGIEIGYDASAFELLGVTGASGVVSTFTTAPDYTVNPYNMSWDSASNVTYNGMLATLTFKILTNKEGEYPITVDFYKGRDGNYTDGDDINYDADFEPLNLVYTSGTITVTGKDEPVTETGAAITVGNASCKVGDTFEIPITIADNTGFASLGIEIGYDAAALELKSVNSMVDTGVAFTTAQSYTVNPYNMNWDSIENTTFNGTLAVLTFAALKPGTHSITVDYYKGRNGDYIDGEDINYDENFIPVKLKYISGSVTVSGSENIPIISVGEDYIDVSLEADSYTGNIIAGLYSADGVLKSVNVYPAAKALRLSFDNLQAGAYVKVMWWDNNMKPMCVEQTVTLK